MKKNIKLLSYYLKNSTKNYLFLLIIFLITTSCKTNHSSINKTERNYVLLVSFDGFRYDYPDRFNLPNFKKLQEKSSYSKGVLSTFPSKTFPNHYSIITGMYAGNHGLVDNKFYSKNLQKTYSVSNKEAVQNPNFYGGIPLWQWLQQHGIKTASYFWVGSEAPITGKFPTYYKKYNSKIPYTERIKQVFDWFALPQESRPQFISLYFEFVDHYGHHTGTFSEKTKQAALLADKLLGKILNQVKKSGLPITTIITSDHGMIDMTSDDDKLIITDKIEKDLSSKIYFMNNGTHSQIYLKNKEDKDFVYEQLKHFFAEKEAVKLYRREDTPKLWNYQKHSNIGDFLLVSKAPYYMITNKENIWAKKTGIWGTHGYDPYTTPEMMAIFYATGNNIKENNRIETFENVHIFPLITKILGVGNPFNIDGKTEVLAPILK